MSITSSVTDFTITRPTLCRFRWTGTVIWYILTPYIEYICRIYAQKQKGHDLWLWDILHKSSRTHGHWFFVRFQENVDTGHPIRNSSKIDLASGTSTQISAPPHQQSSPKEPTWLSACPLWKRSSVMRRRMVSRRLVQLSLDDPTV